VEPHPITSSRAGIATRRSHLKRFWWPSRNNKKIVTGNRGSHSGGRLVSHPDPPTETEVARAVVVKLTCAVPLPEAMLTEEGETAQVEPVGAPLQASATVWVKPPELARFKVNVAVCPALIFAEFEVAVTEKSLVGAVLPVPVNDTECGLPGALSVIVIVPVRFPTAVGANFTVIVQLAPAATALQLLVCVKSPLAAILLMLSDAFPVFVIANT